VKVFISWSGEMSRNVACVLRDKLPYIIQALKPFVSSDDIGKGARWGEVLANQLKETDFGIVCLTPYNIRSPWLNFESGALAKSVDRSRVAPFLFLVDPAQVRGPLAQFQSTVYEKEDIFNLLFSINGKLDPEDQLEHGLLRYSFDHWWPELDGALKSVIGQPGGETETGYSWMYTLGDLKRIELDSGSKSIMVVSPSPDRDLHLSFAEEMVQKNLERGVGYAIVVSKGTNPVVMEAIINVFSSHPKQLSLTPIPEDDFQRMAVTHYLLLNYERDDSDLRVFIELPIEAHDYWIEVNRVAALGFAYRFRDLPKKYGTQAAIPDGTSG
jgi:hypothetical protein